MKKLISILLFLILSMIFSMAYADEIDFSGYTLEDLLEIRTQLNEVIAEKSIQQSSSLAPVSMFDGEILFRGIPWNVSAQEVREKLAADGMISSDHEIKNDDYIYAWKVDEDEYLDSNAGANIAIYSFPETFTVAGYPLASAQMYCPYSYTKQAVDRSIDGTQFMLATMTFDVADIDLVFADLTNKLSSLYGTPEYKEDNNGYLVLAGSGGDYTQYNSWNVWYGANDTGVYLYKTYCQEDNSTTINDAEIQLVYGKVNGIEYLEGLANAAANEQKAEELLIQQQNADNVDGL